MMNILEQEDLIKGLPDQILMREAQAPSGQVPQFLVVSEIQRRTKARKDHEGQQEKPSSDTVAEQIVGEQMGIMGALPQQMAQGMPPQGMPQMRPQGMPPMAPPQAPKPPMPMGGIASAPQAMPPMGMAQGGIVRMDGGGALPSGQFRLFNGSTIADKMAELLDRVRRGELAYPDVLANISSLPASDARDMALSYVQSEVGGNRASAPASRLRMEEGMFGYSDRDADIMGTMEAPLPEREAYPPGKQGREAFSKAFTDTLDSNDAIFYGADGGGIGSLPTEKDIAGARSAFMGRTIQGKRDSLSPSITSQDIDDAVAGMVTERAGGSKPPFGPPASEIYKDSFVTRGFDSLKDGYGYLVGLDQRLAGAANRGIDSFLGSFSNPYGSSDAVQDAQPPMVQTEEEMASEAAYNDLIKAQMDARDVAGKNDNDAVSASADGELTGAEDKSKNEAGGVNLAGNGKEVQSDSVFNIDDYRSRLEYLMSLGVDSDKEVEIPTLDYSDIRSDLDRRTKSNMLFRLAEGIGKGDVASGIGGMSKVSEEAARDISKIDIAERKGQFDAATAAQKRQDSLVKTQRMLGAELMGLDAKLRVSSDTDRRELLRAYSGIRDGLQDQLVALTASGYGQTLPKSSQDLMNRIDKMLQNLAGQYGIVLPAAAEGGADLNDPANINAQLTSRQTAP
tara:strand:+ start:5608 stop:7644 length:2037 start_codon:yes stop_codon:yes gene_type:complete